MGNLWVADMPVAFVHFQLYSSLSRYCVVPSTAAEGCQDLANIKVSLSRYGDKLSPNAYV